MWNKQLITLRQSGMAKYFTLRLSPLAHENKLACSVKYFAISHSDSCNKYYIYYGA